jgi:hypothetical protein
MYFGDYLEKEGNKWKRCMACNLLAVNDDIPIKETENVYKLDKQDSYDFMKAMGLLEEETQ